MALIDGLIYFAIGIILWTVTGHGIWVFIAYVFSARKSCPACRAVLQREDRACRHCGWTSIPVDAKTGVQICRQALEGARQRAIIDAETAKRGEEIILRLEVELARERDPHAHPAASSIESVTVPPVAVPPVTVPPVTVPSVTVPPVAEVVSNAPLSLDSLPRVSQDGAPEDVDEIHPLDRVELLTSPRTESLTSRTWSEWLSAFMEESNIRWGELAGGMLILCCSTALVFSFWEHIASRPWLKFSIFTGINIATLGLGLYAWHRWKLPTTSKGILVIGTLLLPLNFLAFALFTIGVPLDVATFVGEFLSLAILGYLTWHASKVLTPDAILAATVAPIAFSLANLLIRRSVTEQSTSVSIFAWGAALLALYYAVCFVAWKPLVRGSRGGIAQILSYVGVATFGLLLSGGLLAHCSRQPVATVALLSPFVSVLGLPLLWYALSLRSKIATEPGWQVPITVAESVAASLPFLGGALAWPYPVRLIACSLGMLAVSYVVGRFMRRPSIAYVVYAALGVVFVMSGLCLLEVVPWDNGSGDVLIDAISTMQTGYLVAGWSIVCAAIAFAFVQTARLEHARVALHAALFSAVFGTVLLSFFGFGRHEHAIPLGTIYAFYAVALMFIGARRRRDEWLGASVLFVAAASIQWIFVGWVNHSELLRVYACLSGISIALLGYQLVDRWVDRHVHPGSMLMVAASIASVTLTSLFGIVWFLVSELGVGVPGPTLGALAMLIGLWFLVAWTSQLTVVWMYFEWSIVVVSLIGTWMFVHQSEWWRDLPVRSLHPRLIEAFAITLSVCGILLLVGYRVLQTLARRRAVRDVVGPMLSSSDRFVGLQCVGWSAALVVLLLIYGALPGVSQELLPRDWSLEVESVAYVAQGGTQEREVPKLESLELPGMPHASVAWGLGSASQWRYAMPPCMAAWLLATAASVFALWDRGLGMPRSRRSRALSGWIFVSVLLGMGLWYPASTLLESSVAVASALRWLTTLGFGVACVLLCLWIRTINRENESDAFGLFDQLFLSFACTTAIPWTGMAGMVIVPALLRHPNVANAGAAWAVTGFLAVIGGFLFFVHHHAGQHAQRHRDRSVAAIVGALLMWTPFVCWVVMLCVLSLIAHPITGPNPDSLFSRMGLASSYALPILVVAISLVGVSAARPSPNVAFVSAVFLMMAVIVGTTLVLKGDSLRVVSWVGLAALLSMTATLFSNVWQLQVASDTRTDAMLGWSGRPIRVVREEWQRALRQIGAGFLILALTMILGLVVAQRVTLRGLHIASLASLVATLVLMAGDWYFQRVRDRSLWILAIGISITGVVASIATVPQWSLSLACGALLMTGVGILLGTREQGRPRNCIRVLGALFAILVIASVRLLALAPAGVAPGIADRIPIFVLLGCALLAWGHAMLHRDRWSMVWFFGCGQFAGLIETAWLRGFTLTLEDAVWTTLFIQCAIGASISGIAAWMGYGMKARIPLMASAVAVTLACMGWMASNLGSPLTGGGLSFPGIPFGLTIVAIAVGGMSGYWNQKVRDESWVVYLSGFHAATWLLNAMPSEVARTAWLIGIVFATYCLATSFLWRSGFRIAEEAARMLKLPMPVEKPPSTVVVLCNCLLAFFVSAVGVSVQFQESEWSIRFLSAQSIMAVTLAVGFLARYTDLHATPSDHSKGTGFSPQSGLFLRLIAIGILAVFCVSLFWSFQPIRITSLAERIGVATLPILCVGTWIGFGLVKADALGPSWRDAALRWMPALVIATLMGILATIVLESGPNESLSVFAKLCVVLTLTLGIGECLMAALMPGRDPLHLSELGREAYVYGAQGLLVLLFAHLHFAMPWLFQGWLQPMWPIVLMLLGFASIAFSEWSRKKGYSVLVRPLSNCGMLLPILPLVAPWLAPSRVDYGVSLILAAVGYGMFAVMARSAWYTVASVVSANGALWTMLQRNDFSFWQHPQLWVIPPAMCMFVAAQWYRRTLPPQQLAAIRYFSLGSIYVASTSEIYLQGIAQAPWLPMILACLSVLGIFIGIAARIRSMLWLGILFLCVALFSILWYAAVDLEQTWIWYVFGLVLGMLILAIFAMFEKRREDLNRIMESMQHWEE